MLASQAIKAGDGELFVAGGMESMSNAPYLLEKARTGYRMGDGALVDAVVKDGLWCALEGVHMGEEAEIVADKYGISRQAQDQFAYRSHTKAHEATEAGRFRAGILSVGGSCETRSTTGGRGVGIRSGTRIET